MTKHLTLKRLTIPVVGALVIGLLGAGAAIAAFTSTGTASVAVDADAVHAGTTPSVTTSGDTATISFAGITLDSSRSVLGYELRRNGGAVISCSGSPCQDTGLAPGSYSYEVRGVYLNWRGAFSTASASKTIATPNLTFSSSSASCAGGSVTLPAGTTSWTSKVSRSYATSAGATSVSVARTGAGSLSGTPLSIAAGTTESTGTVTLSGLANGNTATVTASATNTNAASCEITVATPAATLTITTATATRQNSQKGTVTFAGTGSSGTTQITVTVYSDNTCTTTAGGTATLNPATAGTWGPTGSTGNLDDNKQYWAKAAQGASSSNCFSFSIPNYS